MTAGVTWDLGSRGGAAVRWSVAALTVALAVSVIGEPLPATIGTVSGDVTAGYVTGADKDGIFISLQPDGGNSFKLPYQNIRDRNIEEPKGWAAALGVLQSGNYSEAEPLFGKLAQEFDKLVPLKDSFGSLARLYHFKCLQQNGKYKELAAAMDRQLANPLSLGPYFSDELDALKGWALLGKQDWQAMATYLKGFVDATVKSGMDQPPFVPMRTSRMSELAYLRAVLHEQQKESDLALLDYHRAMTADLGSDRKLFGLACLAALRLEDSKLRTNPDDVPLKRSAHALAVVYRDSVGAGKIPQEYGRHLEKPPELPKAPPPSSQSEASAPPASNKPVTTETQDTPERSKGKGKGKGKKGKKGA